MPTYTFKEKDTGEIKEVYVKISEYDNFVSQNLNLERVFLEAPRLCDPYSLGRLKPPADFQKHIVGSIKARNPGALGSKKWDTPREI